MQATSDPRVRGNMIFLLIQVAALLGLAGLYAHGSKGFVPPPAVPPLPEKPRTLGPLYDDPHVVTDEQLRRVLWRLRPRLVGQKTLVGDLEHALRLWGPTAKFGDPEFVDGADLLRLLTDHRRFAEFYGADHPPLLIDKGTGVGVRVDKRIDGSPHTDHLAAILADLGTPLDQPVVLPGRETTYRALVEQTLRDFLPNQEEYEWSAATFALLLPPTKTWWTGDGQQMSFDLLADRILRENLPRGVCLAQHRLTALVLFLRVDAQTPILRPDTRERIDRFLLDATVKLTQHQHPDGFWNGDWPDAAPASSQPTDTPDDQRKYRLIVTGHALEWWAMAPERFHPPRPVLVSAGQWLVRTIDAMSPEEMQANFTFLSHVGSALALWRSRRAVDVLQDPQAKTPAADRP